MELIKKCYKIANLFNRKLLKNPTLKVKVDLKEIHSK
jgi:hypothetical protein